MRELSRRQLVAWVGAAGLATGTTLSASERIVAQSVAGDWPQFGGGPRNRGHAPEATAPSSPSQRWAFEAGSRVTSSPVVTNGTVYLGSDDGNLYAADANTGEQQWVFETDSGVASSPAVDDSSVYVGSDTNLYAVNAMTGEQQWIFDTSNFIYPPPTTADGTVFVGNRGGTLYAVDSATGEQQWAFDTGGSVRSSPAVADGTVFFGSEDTNLYALDSATGTEQWKFNAYKIVWSSPAVANSIVYVGSDNSTLYAVDTVTGEQQWAFGTDEVRSSPAVADGTVFVGSDDGNLYAVDAATGRQRWTFETGGYIESSPAVVNRTVFVGSDNILYAVDAATGKQQWTFETGDHIESSPAVVDGTVFVGSNDNNLYAISNAGTPTSTQTRTETETQTRTEPETQTRTEPETQTRTEPETQPPTADDDRLPTDTLVGIGGGATGLGLLALLYRAHYSSSNDDDGDSQLSPASPDDGSGGSPLTPTSGAESTSQSGMYRSASIVSTNTPVKNSTSNSPDTISSPPSQNLDYGEIEKGDRVGTGGNANVYEAWLPDGDRIALKEPRMSGTVDTTEVERVIEEARTWDKLDDHDHIVGVIDYGADPVPWIGLEYMDAGDMSMMLTTEPSFEARVWTAVSICRAVRHAHRRGVAHLDIKPANVLFRSTEESWPVPKVSDWGLAKMLLDHSQSVEGFTPNYAAPEQFAADEYGPPDDITDIYQVGAVCYELFTGEPPFEGSHAGVMRSVLDNQPSPPSSIAEVPTELDDVLLSALAKQKADRYESIIELRDALAGLSDYR